MDPDPSSSPLQPAATVPYFQVRRHSDATDPFELFEKARSLSAIGSSERIDRIEGFLVGIAEKFSAQQLQMQTQLQQVAEAQRTQVVPRSSGPRLFATSSEHGSGAFIDYTKARDRSMRMGSLDASEGAGPAAARMPCVAPEPVPFRSPPPNPPTHEPVPTVLATAEFWPEAAEYERLGLARLPKFSGKEIYIGVCADYLAWGKKFVQRLVAAQMMNGGDWPDDFKILALNNKLKGPALAFFGKMLPKWTAGSNTVEHVIDRMLGFYSTKVPVPKAMNLISEAKSGDKSWTEHFQYLVYVAERAGCPDQFVLQCLCDSAPEHVKKAMLTRLNSIIVHHIQQAYHLDETERWSWRWISWGGEPIPVVVVAKAVVEIKGKVSLDALMLAEPVSVGHAVKKAISRATVLRDESLLQDAVDYSDAWSTANGGTLKVTEGGTVAQVDLTNVFYCKDVTNNIISYGLLGEKGVYLTRHNDKSYVERAADGRRLFEVRREGTVLVIDTFGGCMERERVNAVLSAVESAQANSQVAETACTLVELHNRLGRLAFDAVERMADARGSGIKLTSRESLNCLACAQDKQHKGAQSKKDTRQNASVDKIGGVICSDIKGPMNLKDRHGNCYMINFVDHSSNYVRAFLAKNKVEAAKRFEQFLKQYNDRVHVLRTDDGGEYKNVEEFCRAAGVRRQVSEANNQASNGKAERMHRTMLNLARCMLFASGLPLKFGGYAVAYAAYVLNRSSCSANAKRMSPIEVLTGKCPDLAGIVTFGSPCTVYRDPGK
ncbi:LOW QUALITY PROTEIN: hypothetical protein PHMEG_00011502 [Phytophthora megakarya]|uniref:Integrase catalytic domain-containing protein n=1 Tax=Phytophthora megakarya TaxID=4795 RepID=A0A225WBJ7_9STRA|nr:LOW QUALITY PROTEIN: hypothetical protein PHMEG_00011502 [Phytophthora megakarya]